MKEYDWKELSGLVSTLGRTYVSELQQALYFNWSASGIAFQFHGTLLTARFCAEYGEEVEGVPWDETAPPPQNLAVGRRLLGRPAGTRAHL